MNYMEHAYSNTFVRKIQMILNIEKRSHMPSWVWFSSTYWRGKRKSGSKRAERFYRRSHRRINAGVIVRKFRTAHSDKKRPRTKRGHGVLDT